MIIQYYNNPILIGGTTIQSRDLKRLEKSQKRRDNLLDKMYKQLIIDMQKIKTPSISSSINFLKRAKKEYEKGNITKSLFNSLMSFLVVTTLAPPQDIAPIIPYANLEPEIYQQKLYIPKPIAPGGRGFTGIMSNPEILLQWHMVPSEKLKFSDKELKKRLKIKNRKRAESSKLEIQKPKLYKDAPKQSKLYKKYAMRQLPVLK